MAERRIEIAAIVGSLRRQSYNRNLLRTAMLTQPADMRIHEVPIAGLPFFDEDLEAKGEPPTVRDLKQVLARADGVLIVTPEYGYSIPGVLKNALDWASRPTGRSVLRGKPVAIMGASSGRSGTMRAQLHLRQVLQHMAAVTIPEPEVYVTFAPDKFNGLGELTDKTSLDQVRLLVHNLREWILLLDGAR
ncbi:MAG: NAD(P)H-dependent oxidoreductase [Thermomicrobiales bacterium]